MSLSRSRNSGSGARPPRKAPPRSAGPGATPFRARETRIRLRNGPGQHEAPAAQRPGLATDCSVSHTRTCGHGVGRLRPQILLGAIRLDLAVHEEPADGSQCDQEKLLHRATSSFLGVRDFCRSTIHTGRYRSVTCLEPNCRPVIHLVRPPKPAFSGPVEPYEWCSSEDRRTRGVGPRNRGPDPHHRRGKQTGPPESEGP